MPYNEVIQYGSFGLVVFVVIFLLVWFVRVGFPRTLEAGTSCIDKVLGKIDQIEASCREERKQMLAIFREEREIDRKARHDQGVLYQKSLAEIAEMMGFGKPPRKNEGENRG